MRALKKKEKKKKRKKCTDVKHADTDAESNIYQIKVDCECYD